MQASGPGSSCGGRSETEAEAARLLARLQSEPTPQHEAELWEWVEAHPSHAVAFAQAEAAWDAAERLKCVATDIPLSSPTEVFGVRQQKRLSRNLLIVAALAAMPFIIGALVMLFDAMDQ